MKGLRNAMGLMACLSVLLMLYACAKSKPLPEEASSQAGSGRVMSSGALRVRSGGIGGQWSGWYKSGSAKLPVQLDILQDDDGWHGVLNLAGRDVEVQGHYDNDSNELQLESSGVGRRGKSRTLSLSAKLSAGKTQLNGRLNIGAIHDIQLTHKDSALEDVFADKGNDNTQARNIKRSPLDDIADEESGASTAPARETAKSRSRQGRETEIDRLRAKIAQAEAREVTPASGGRHKQGRSFEGKTIEFETFDVPQSLPSPSIPAKQSTETASSGKESFTPVQSLPLIKDDSAVFRRQADPDKQKTPSDASVRDSRRAPIALRSEIDAKRLDSECPRLLSWAKMLDKEFMDKDIEDLPREKLYDHAALLFTDRNFIQVFGQAYDEVSPADKEKVYQQLVYPCTVASSHHAQQFGWKKALVSQVFSPSMERKFEDTIRQYLRGNRQVGNWMAKVNQLERDLTNPKKYREVKKIIDNINIGLLYLWPSEQQAMRDKIAAWRSASIQAQVEAKLTAASQKKLKLDQVIALETLSRELKTFRSDVDAVQYNTFEERLAAAQKRAYGEFEKATKSLWQKAGKGINAVEAGGRWYHEHGKRMEKELPKEIVADVMDAFWDWRENQIEGAKGDIVSAVHAAGSTEHAVGVITQYLRVPGDLTIDAGKNLMDAAAAQIGEANVWNRLSVILKYYQLNGVSFIPNNGVSLEPGADDIRKAFLSAMHTARARSMDLDVKRIYILPTLYQNKVYVDYVLKNIKIEKCIFEDVGDYTCIYYVDAEQRLDKESRRLLQSNPIGSFLLSVIDEENKHRPLQLVDRFVLNISGWESPTEKERWLSEVAFQETEVEITQLDSDCLDGKMFACDTAARKRAENKQRWKELAKWHRAGL